ncbi:MAG: hypothetical protein IJF73_06945 [Clostridia bacterium]|nr:hypothetical protein [Clostridia bacterium]
MTAPYDRLGAVLDNLGENAAALLRWEEKRLGHIAELAETLVSELSASGEVGSPRALLSALSSAVAALPPPTLPEGGLARHRPALLAALTALSDRDRAHLATAVRTAVEGRLGRPLSLSDFAGGPVPPRGEGRLVYVQNPHTDHALSRLLPLVGTPTVTHRESFRELVDDVQGGHADYALLPLRSGGTPIASVSAMLEEHGLAVLAVLSLDAGGSEAVFGLLGRESVRLGPPTHFLFTSALPGLGLAGLLSALSALPVTLERWDALALDGGEGDLYRLSVRGDDATLVPFLVYLSLFVPGYIGHGFYFEQERNTP